VIAPQFSVALNNLGTIAYQSRYYEEVADYFRQALQQEPDGYAPLVNLGGALLSAGKIQEALEYNLRAVKAKPADALAHAQLGQSYLLLGRFDLAEVELKKSKALDPAHFSFPQLVLAELYLRQQNAASAIEELGEFLKLHPDSDRAPNLCILLEKLRGKASPHFSTGFCCGGGSGHVCCVALGRTPPVARLVAMPVCTASRRNLVRNEG